MADVFEGRVTLSNSYVMAYYSDSNSELRWGTMMAGYAAHAINSHDELVAEIERLRGALSNAASAFDKLQLKEYGKNSFMVSRGEMKEFAAHHFSIATAALNYDK